MMQFFVIVAIVLVWIIKSWTDGNKKDDSPTTGGENFPFPWGEDTSGDIPRPHLEQMEEYNNEQEIAEYKEVKAKLAKTTPPPPPTIQSNIEEKEEDSDSPILTPKVQKKKEKFNVRQAVIYSEILNPKFKDYEI